MHTALLNQKEQEGTKAFQQIIKEVEETRVSNYLFNLNNTTLMHFANILTLIIIGCIHLYLDTESLDKQSK